MRNLVKENLTNLQSNYMEWTKIPYDEGFNIDEFIEDVFLTENRLMDDGEHCRMNCIEGDYEFNEKGMDDKTIFDVICVSIDYYIHGIWCYEDFEDDEDSFDEETGEEMLKVEQDIIDDRLQEFKKLYKEMC